MILKGKKVQLRPVKISDTKMLHRWINNKRLNRFLATTIPISLAQERKIVHQMVASKKAKYFVIEKLDTNEPIGMMTLYLESLKNHRGATGAFIAYSKYWGKGYGTDAKMTLLKYAFLKLKLNRIVTQVFLHNPRSVAYNMKCGYKKEGLLRQNIFKKGKYYDSIVLAVLKRDWLKLAKSRGYL